jgi:hypothetical protein
MAMLMRAGKWEGAPPTKLQFRPFASEATIIVASEATVLTSQPYCTVLRNGS